MLTSGRIAIAATFFAAIVLARPAPAGHVAFSDEELKRAYDNSKYDLVYNYADTNEEHALVKESALHLLVIAAFQQPDYALASADAKTLRDLAVERLKHIINGKGPSFRGNLHQSWNSTGIALSLLLVRNSAPLWESFSALEREKCDFLMKCFAVSANYYVNTDNNYLHDICQLPSKLKHTTTVNPNMWEGTLMQMVAAAYYFDGSGAMDAVNAILAAFSYKEYIANFKQYGYENGYACWTQTPTIEKLLENGTDDPQVGKAKGVRAPMRFHRDVDRRNGATFAPANAIELLQKMIAIEYCHKVQSVVSRTSRAGVLQEAYIRDRAVSPFEGQDGMLMEFVASDAEGMRSSLGYVVSGWKTHSATLATLIVLNKADAITLAERQLVYVGSEDFIFKAEKNYYTFQHAKNFWEGVGQDNARMRCYPYAAAIYKGIVRPFLLQK